MTDKKRKVHPSGRGNIRGVWTVVGLIFFFIGMFKKDLYYFIGGCILIGIAFMATFSDEIKDEE